MKAKTLVKDLHHLLGVGKVETSEAIVGGVSEGGRCNTKHLKRFRKMTSVLKNMNFTVCNVDFQLMSFQCISPVRKSPTITVFIHMTCIKYCIGVTSRAPIGKEIV